MGFFDFFKSNKKGKAKTFPDAKVDTSNTVSSKSEVDDLCSENGFKKHCLLYILLEPQRCYFICRDFRENEEASFIFNNKELYTMEPNDAISGYIFMWIVRTLRNDQNDFTRFFEILNRSHVECYSVALGLTAEKLVNKIRYYFPNFSLGNNPDNVKTALEWTYIDICILKKYFSEATKYILDHFSDTNIPMIQAILDCTSLQDLLNYNVQIIRSTTPKDK